MLRALANLRIFPSTSACRRFASTTGGTEALPTDATAQEETQNVVEKDEATAERIFVKQPYSMETIKLMKLDEYPYYVEREWWKKGKRMTFWATWRQLRDVKRRELIQEVGPDRMRLKAIKENTILPQAIRDEAAEKLFTMPKYAHPKLVLNMCMFTGRQRGKIKPYRVNRHIFRKLADHGQLSGVQRAMWS